MQTKNVNLSQAPLNNATIILSEKNQQAMQASLPPTSTAIPVSSPQHVLISPMAPAVNSGGLSLYLQAAPPLPPRVSPAKLQQHRGGGLLIVAPGAMTSASQQCAGAANPSGSARPPVSVLNRGIPFSLKLEPTRTTEHQAGADVDGYGPYKPVPPPKPLPATGFQPPPYRMPPVPQHGATGPEQQHHHELPGVMMGDQGLSSGLQTHSSKFPIEREVILTSGVEKSSATFKARLLPELRGPGGPGATSRLQPVHSPRGQHRAAPASIAPDAPTRHLAWTPDSTPKHRVSVDAEQLILTRVHTESSFTEDELAHQRAVYKAHALHDMPRGHGPPQDPHGVYVRSPYMPGGPDNPYMYTTHTGAVPRGWPGPRGDDGPSQDPRSVYSPPPRPRPSLPQPVPAQQQQPHMNGHGEPRAPAPAPRTTEPEHPPHRPPPISAAEQEETKPTSSTPAPKNFPAKTYHTIKDMISTRFGGKGALGDGDTGGMNNSRQSQLRASGKSLKSEGELLQTAPQQQQAPSQQHQQSQQQPQQSNYSGQPQHQFMHHHHPPPQTRTPTSRFQESQLSAGQQSPDEGGFTQTYTRPAAEGKSEAEGEYYYARATPDPGSLYVAMRYQQQQQQQQQQVTSSAEQPEPRSRTTLSTSPAREAGDGGGRASGGSSDYEKATHSSGSAAHTTDSGRGPSLPPPGQRDLPRLDTSTESSDLSPQSRTFGLSQTAESEWVDLVESELRQILEPRLLAPHLHPGGSSGAPPAVAPRHGANSTMSESVGSMTPPLPPLSPSGSPCGSPKLRHYKLQAGSSGQGNSPSKGKSGSVGVKASGARGTTATGNSSTQRGGWSASRSKGSAPTQGDKQRGMSSNKKDQGKGKMVLSPLHTFGPPDSAADLTSTTTGLDLDSVLDGQTENTSDDEEDDDLSTTVDATDAQAIRRQLEGLENMYSEVLKMLGVKKYGTGGRYLPGGGSGGATGGRRRLYGSLSSLPSSVSSRPVRERRGRQDDRKRVKDVKGINKRFQRLESHVVTLARSVAHLSSEMRTQHLMIQEMENIRGEIAQLRASQPSRSHSVPRLTAATRSGSHEQNNSGLSGTQSTRIKKLTKFFGDEPPLLRLFLRKLGYEKYANNFEQEKVGLMELPYMSEDRLQKMGIPMGPRLRIIQEAQAAALCSEGFSVYVV